jgi:predicted ATPase
MLTRIEIKNFRSIYDVSIPLSPFTLLIGANGAGKSNLMRLIDILANTPFNPEAHPPECLVTQKHKDHLDEPQTIKLFSGDNLVESVRDGMYLPLKDGKPIDKILVAENIGEGLHPRLFQRLVEDDFELAQTRQIIATTHNPYFVDEFKDNEGAVLIVEKVDGYTRFSTMADRLEGLDLEEQPLGSVWYSGAVGGVPI